jgi:hypothetical protein
MNNSLNSSFVVNKPPKKAVLISDDVDIQTMWMAEKKRMAIMKKKQLKRFR